MFELYIKYLLEGIAVAIAAYFIPRKKVEVTEIIFIALSAAATFAILDIFAPKVGDGARKGAGFGIGANTVGWPGLERFEDKSDDSKMSDDKMMSEDDKKKWCGEHKKSSDEKQAWLEEYNKKCSKKDAKKEKFYGGSSDSNSVDTVSTDSSKSVDTKSTDSSKSVDTKSTDSSASSVDQKKPATSDEVSGYDENKAYASF
jgi:hypothetical protein